MWTLLKISELFWIAQTLKEGIMEHDQWVECSTGYLHDHRGMITEALQTLKWHFPSQEKAAFLVFFQNSWQNTLLRALNHYLLLICNHWHHGSMVQDHWRQRPAFWHCHKANGSLRLCHGVTSPISLYIVPFHVIATHSHYYSLECVVTVNLWG